MRSIFSLIFLCLGSLLRAEDALPVEQIDARLRQAMAIARETNKTSLVDDLLVTRDHVTKAIERKDAALIERLLRDMEKEVGLDAGGKSMAGLPVARLTYRELKQFGELSGKLTVAMKAANNAEIQGVIADLRRLLGDRVGVPDTRRKGENPKILPIKPVELADLFGRILDAEQAKLKRFLSGAPSPGVIPRDYANIAEGCVAIRPLMEKHQPKRIEALDKIIVGCCDSMVALQTERGFFKFPDLRGKHIRFGEMIEQLAEQSAANLEDGWVIVPAPDGGSQFDAGECGVTLLRAGAVLKNPAWTKAGLKAADWAIGYAPVANFNYNAFSVRLLAEAFRQTKNAKYLDAAWGKWKNGILPGQSQGGRWIDPHNARTIYHFMILRAANDLLDVSAPGEDRTLLKKSVQRSVTAILDEADKLGVPITAYTIQELGRVAHLAEVTDSRLANRLEQAATVAHLRCIQNGVRAATPFPELVALTNIWK